MSTLTKKQIKAIQKAEKLILEAQDTSQLSRDINSMAIKLNYSMSTIKDLKNQYGVVDLHRQLTNKLEKE